MVFKGSRLKTQAGLTKDSLKRNKCGKIVSTKASENARRNYPNTVAFLWAQACKEAREMLGLTGFVPLGGQTDSGKRLYAMASALVKAKQQQKPCPI